MRLHGDREPHKPQFGEGGGAACLSGADNEVWSYGDHVYEICKTYMKLREEMRDYTRTLMKDAHEMGSPIMRPLFYDFPGDSKCWEVESQYMYGSKYLCCPVLQPDQRKMSVYLPAGETWKAMNGENCYDGGKWVDVDCPIEIMPVFIRQG